MFILELLRRLNTDEDGATAAEYGLLVALIAVVMAIGAEALGIGISNLFEEVNAQL